MITLSGYTLTVEEMKRLLLEGERVTVCPTSMQKVAECREAVENISEYGRDAYGSTTGVGKCSEVHIKKAAVR
ncbi:aromatic amino acid lyase, partial [Bacillus sp. S1-R5C1-FB]|uniref:aromatic amino acid lyase n=1 Tax=Bacillus sp. S1-R5C1-FB TaxID=1973491 RepID=UPI0015C50359